MPERRARDNRAMLLAHATRLLLDPVLPPRCPGCGAIGSSVGRFCAECWQQLDFLPQQGCEGCNLPLPEADGTHCAKCLVRLPRHGPVRAAVAYGPIAKDVVLRLKYGRRPVLARTIAALLPPPVEQGALVIPVPLHRWRLWARGYNQAAEIGRLYARQHGLAFDPLALKRVRATPSLRGLSGKQREDAVRGAFSCARHLGRRPVMLVDDVYTSGATVEACARTLRRAGAGPIETLCWARVVASD